MAGMGGSTSFERSSRARYIGGFGWRELPVCGVAVQRRDFVGDEVVAAPSCDGIGRAGEDWGRRSVLEPHRGFLERIEQSPHLTLHGLKNELAARGVKVSHNAVWLFLRQGCDSKNPVRA